jgi:hypothetical protein
VLFERDASGNAHGNFHPASWKAMRANPNWAGRLEKVHSRASALPQPKRASARELDSCNSSDALLMNCFCFPRIGTSLLGIASSTSSAPVFGIRAEVSLADGTPDATEIDMEFGGMFVEAKLTEADFTVTSEAHIRRYKKLDACFDVAFLPREEGALLGYQLIRNVLAAQQHGKGLLVLLDGRRPDLLREWWRIHSAIAHPNLRLRCGVRTWQEVAAASPPTLREFLNAKYGL